LWEEARLAGNFLKVLEELPTEAEVAYGGRTSGCHWLAGGHRVHLRNHTTRRGYGWLHRLRDSGGVHIY